MSDINDFINEVEGSSDAEKEISPKKLEFPENPPEVEQIPPVGDDAPSIELPSFEAEMPIPEKLPVMEADSEVLDVPLPPPELKAKAPRVRFQEIEDEYLEEAPSDEEIEEAEEETLYPIYVNVDDYSTLLETFKSSKGNIKTFINGFSRLEDLGESLEGEFVKINKTFENIQRKLITIDNRLFERGGD